MVYDVSTDGSVEVIKDFADIVRFIKYIINTNILIVICNFSDKYSYFSS